MQDEKDNLLHRAIARGSPVVLSLPSAGLLRNHKSRFVGSGDNSLFIESIPTEMPLIDELITSQRMVGVSFRDGHNKIIFATPIWERRADHRINAEMTVEALMMPYPLEFKSVQRRASYRVQVGTYSEVSVRMWRLPPRALLRDKPGSSYELTVGVNDISVGGLGVVFTAADMQLKPTDRLRVEIKYKEKILLVEGMLRYSPGDIREGICRCGIKFKSLENDLPGRQTLTQLTKIVGELQRDEVRRRRLGLTG